MSLLDQSKENRPIKKPKSTKETNDFSKIGGLNHHLRTLREIVIFPLLHGNVFAHFKIKAPRGVLFYGPPGTGKTLVAGALAAELNKEGVGKVSFFPRKGADILDKWVGESEKNLRALFEKATKSRPSIIFFDELDGLAPIRSDKNDHVHSSVVATLLSLLDGLDTKPGVIVIGATNRIEAIDPALRRKGRFDKELYFPLPGTLARRDILQILTSNWKRKPSGEFLEELADMTHGFCGADLQALCSDAVLTCLRRAYPKIDSRGADIKVEPDLLQVEESDFLEARTHLVPSNVKYGLIMRKLSHTVKPLLRRQHDRIIKYINLLWPHFLQEDYEYKFAAGDRRYAARVLLIGDNTQGLNTHLLPSVLKNLEHIPQFVLDTRSNLSFQFNITSQFPSVIILSRVDEWWEDINEYDQHNIVTSLEEIHAGLPILTIASCNVEVPGKLHNFFYNNNTLLVRIENPTEREREEFLAPLFFDENNLSVSYVWNRWSRLCTEGKGKSSKKKNNFGLEIAGLLRKGKRKRESSLVREAKKIRCTVKKSSSDTSIFDLERKITNMQLQLTTSCDSVRNKQYFTRVLSDLLNKRNTWESNTDTTGIGECCSYDEETSREKIYNVWKHASEVTTRNMGVSHLETLYDVISACVAINQNSFDDLVVNLENVLEKIENSYRVSPDGDF
ncbi:unnamed protein product [Phyllotreta striolata]|uniref:AAA+ ATPase domain-containing protein n=1 Tax=Phyllotreta striolata TaxID=444603 RepID=A0A9N9XP44_PHYSR|nr:unnamed protein product [Phyllotreta striolata]